MLNPQVLVQNSQARSILKTISWRIIATVIMGAIVYSYTGHLREATEITLIAGVFLTIGYYLHERFWIWLRARR